jgi:hypothetical protein
MEAFFVAIRFIACTMRNRETNDEKAMGMDDVDKTLALAGKAKHAKRMNSAIRVIGAPNNYSRYFDDLDFRAIAH